MAFAAILMMSAAIVAMDGHDMRPIPQNIPSPAPAIVDLELISAGTEDLAGRIVFLEKVPVLRLAATHGFFLDSKPGAVYVMPDPGVVATVAPRDVVTIRGVVAKMPKLLPGEIDPPTGWNARIYIAASAVTK